MHFYSRLFLLCFFLWCSSQSYAQKEYWKYVNPFIGTAPSEVGNSLKHSIVASESSANTIPAVTLPFAMTQWTPQTRRNEEKCVAPYYYNDSLFNGIRATHWLSGSCTQDYGSMTILPILGTIPSDFTTYSYKISHADESTSPSLYRVKLEDLVLEQTSSTRCGITKITSLKTDTLTVLFTINSSDKGKDSIGKDVLYFGSPARRIYQGWGESAGFDGSFCVRIKLGGKLLSTSALSVKRISLNDLIVRIPIKKGNELQIETGTSFSGFAGAKKNLDSELGGKNFDLIRLESEQQWKRILEQVKIPQADSIQKTIFYTAMYHMYQQPRLFSDVDGSYPVFSKKYQVGKLKSGNYYDDFSMWDTYRAQLPLLQLLDEDLTSDFVNSILFKAKDGGWLPIFPCWNNYTSAMIGDHCIAYISSAIMHGIKGIDVEEAYNIMRKNAFDTSGTLHEYMDGKGRRALKSYMRFGYVPLEDSVPYSFHKDEQVSRTLEYAYDDYCLSLVAKKLGKKEDYKMLQKRSENYKNVFNPKWKMVNGRYEDGSWFKEFKSDDRAKFITEGTPRQYTFYVPQDVEGLKLLMGGRDAMERSLDSLFELNQYWHGNEPSHHIAFLYNNTGHPQKTYQTVRHILETEYGATPGGLSGNDDSGQMSAWYVLASLGFYPVNPMDGKFVKFEPYFKDAEMYNSKGARIKL